MRARAVYLTYTYFRVLILTYSLRPLRLCVRMHAAAQAHVLEFCTFGVRIIQTSRGMHSSTAPLQPICELYQNHSEKSIYIIVIELLLELSQVLRFTRAAARAVYLTYTYLRVLILTPGLRPLSPGVRMHAAAQPDVLEYTINREHVLVAVRYSCTGVPDWYALR